MQRHLVLLGLFLPAGHVAALGTPAGSHIQNSATANYSISGVPQPPVSSNTTQTIVDELIDVAVVNNNGGPVAVTAGQTSALLEFNVSNNGNDDEVFRVIARADVIEGGFDPVISQLYLESNGQPGLQTASDTPYVSGAADPNIAVDSSLIVYVLASIPSGLIQNELGEIQLRAVAASLISQSGTDNPSDPAWPSPGTAYPGLGLGGGDLVSGISHDVNNLVLRAGGQFQVSTAVVSVEKTSIQVVDPIGGSRVVPGAIVTYRLEISALGSGSANDVVIRDVFPVELEYVSNSLNIDGQPEDDDFFPNGVDGAGYDPAQRTVVVAQSTLSGGAPATVITFQAAVR